ncbi:MAG: iron transporter [Coriobacteriales bacterium]|jgi:uncharacterized protein involved in high-affinity Fe2+ transport|nr:iron transporter [Coriobacteriales bacterium]
MRTAQTSQVAGKEMTRKAVALLAALALLAMGLLGSVGCTTGTGTASGSDSGEESSADSGGVAAPGEAGGFEEFPLGDDQVVGPLNVAGVYFQPVDMEPAGNSLPAAQSDAHLEADISAAEGNKWGYGVGDFVPNLTVDYEITDSSGKVVDEGAFMPMSASDGPHYGANVKFGPAGTYTVKFIIHSPEEQGYLLHTDPETGVDGDYSSYKFPYTVEFTFDWDAREW